jgi:hypothetical protein
MVRIGTPRDAQPADFDSRLVARDESPHSRAWIDLDCLLVSSRFDIVFHWERYVLMDIGRLLLPRRARHTENGIVVCRFALLHV